MIAGMKKIGLIAGAGDLPVMLAQYCRDAGVALHVSRISGMSDPRLAGFSGSECPLASFGERMKALKADHVTQIVFAGLVARPDFQSLKPDWRGALALPRIVGEMGKGDDALLRAVLGEFERDGFEVIGADDVLEDLLAPIGLMAGAAPTQTQQSDLETGLRVTAQLGLLDIGQGAVVCDGLVLAVEAQEGTDRMLARVAELNTDIRGTPAKRRGVLVKRAKPQQERRIDLPTIGVKTIEGAAKAGLAGVVVEARGALIIDKASVVAACQEVGMFLLGADISSVPQ
jgi:UDP-2,3-diacylglucosamine hydrolase